jgi:hypothetical protein
VDCGERVKREFGGLWSWQRLPHFHCTSRRSAAVTNLHSHFLAYYQICSFFNCLFLSQGSSSLVTFPAFSSCSLSRSGHLSRNSAERPTLIWAFQVGVLRSEASVSCTQKTHQLFSDLEVHTQGLLVIADDFSRVTGRVHHHDSGVAATNASWLQQASFKMLPLTKTKHKPCAGVIDCQICSPRYTSMSSLRRMCLIVSTYLK